MITTTQIDLRGNDRATRTRIEGKISLQPDHYRFELILASADAPRNSQAVHLIVDADALDRLHRRTGALLQVLRDPSGLMAELPPGPQGLAAQQRLVQDLGGTLAGGALMFYDRELEARAEIDTAVTHQERLELLAASLRLAAEPDEPDTDEQAEVIAEWDWIVEAFRTSGRDELTGSNLYAEVERANRGRGGWELPDEETFLRGLRELVDSRVLLPVVENAAAQGTLPNDVFAKLTAYQESHGLPVTTRQQFDEVLRQLWQAGIIQFRLR